MIKTGTLPIRGVRTNPLKLTITFKGIDLTGADLQGYVLQNWDNSPSSPQVSLPDGVGAGVTGLSLGTVSTVDGVVQSPVTLFISASDMAGIISAAEVGTDLNWVWYLDITPAGGIKQRYLEGAFIVGGSQAGRGNISATAVQVADEAVTVVIDGVEIVSEIANRASDAADRAEVAAAEVEPLNGVLDVATADIGTTTGATTALASYVAIYGYPALYDCHVSAVRAAFAGNGTGKIFVVRHDDPATGKYRVESVSDITFVTGENTFSVDADLKTGDMIMVGASSGNYLKTLPSGAFGFATTVRPAVNDLFTVLPTAKPAIALVTNRSDSFNALSSDTTEATAFAKGSAGSTVATIGTLAHGAATETSFSTFSVGPRDRVSADGILQEITYKTKTLSGSVAALVVVYDSNGIVKSTAPIVGLTDASGFVTLTRADFGWVPLSSGDAVQVFAPDTRSAVSIFTDGGAQGSVTSKSTFAVGDVAAPNDAYVNTAVITVTIDAIAQPKALATAAQTLANTRSAPRTKLVETAFPGAALPADWSQLGGWTVNDGLVPPASGDFTTWAIINQPSSIYRRRFTTRVLVNDSASIFGICSKPQVGNGAVALVDGSAGTLTLYHWNGSTTVGYNTQVDLAAPLVAGRAYMLTVEQDGTTKTITLTDSLTQDATVLVEVATDGVYQQFHGSPGLMFQGGDVVFEWFEVDAPYPKNLHAVIIGDSITEGLYLVKPGLPWSALLSNRRQIENDILVAARAGDDTPNMLGRLPTDLQAWLPKYVVLAMGTNDTDQAVWRTNIAATIDMIEALGAEPILSTQIPRDSSQALRDAMNADIMGGYFGRYRYIDFAASVSLNHDRQTWDPDYDRGDHTHPNSAGAVLMYQQALIDAPFLA